MQRLGAFTAASDSATASDPTFAEARTTCQSQVFAFVFRRLGNFEEAEDATAATFVDAYRHWRKRRGDARLWLFGIARRKVADALRRRKRSVALRETDVGANAMDEFVDRVEVAQARAILDRLTPDEREALLMTVVEGFSISEVAVVLGRSTKAVNSLLGRARVHARRLAETSGHQP